MEYNLVNNLKSNYPMEYDFIAHFSGESENKIKNAQKTINYLLAAKYFEHFIEDGKNYVAVTSAGITIYNSEHFLHIYNEEKAKRNNNRWMIFTNCVIAFGVIYSIYQGRFDVKSDKEIQQDNLQMSSKITHLVLDSLKASLSYKKVDSTVIILKKP